MNKVHRIKLNYEFQEPILSGEKTFEVRWNDRGYQKGDFVEFRVAEGRRNAYEPIESRVYRITYVLSGWHIEPGYVAFGIKEVKDGDGDG
jgi:ParB family chromosome partitioning protein